MNQPGPCHGNDFGDARYCPVNHCVLNDVCYAGNGSVVMDIDGTGSTHMAICVGYGWWDCDAGLPGMSVCGLCGYNWTNATSSSVGEYQWHNGTGYGCCGDDTGEYLHGDGFCYATPLRKPKPKKETPIEEPKEKESCDKSCDRMRSIDERYPLPREFIDDNWAGVMSPAFFSASCQPYSQERERNNQQ